MNPNGTNNKAYKVILANSTTVAKTGTISGVANNLHNVQKSDVNKAKLSTELAMILQSRQRQDFTREWVRNSIKDYLLEQEKMGKEAHTRMLRELQNKEIYHFNCFFSITENQFNFLVRKLKEKITGYNPKRHKKFFTAEERLSITLKYLATGEFNSCRNYCFRATKPVILNMISKICLDMYEALKDDYIATPKTESEWQMVSKEFMQKTNLTNCLGDLTMKHIVSKSSKPFSQKTEFNSDNTLVFTSLVDSNENFIYVDISKTKSYMNDPTVFENSEIKAKVENEMCSFVPKTGRLNNLPYYFTTNSRLGLPKKTYLMKCRNESQIESHRDYEFYEAIKKANQKSTNALKYISNIFGAFTYPLKIDLENGRNILLGAIALYNFLRKTEPGFYQICENIKNYHEEEIPKEKMQDYDYLAKPVVFLHDCFQNLCTQLGDDSFEETDEINRNALMDLCFKKSCET